MRTRTVLTATVVAVLPALAAIPLAGVASAAPAARECRDFASQAAAQSALVSHSVDPGRLDPDRNGVACENYFRTALPAAAPGATTPGDPTPGDTTPGDTTPGAADPDDAAPADPAADPATDPTADPTADLDADPTADPTTDPGADPTAEPTAAPTLPSSGLGETSVKTGAPADAAVRTVPERQILVAPRGAAETGDGSTSTSDGLPVTLLAGGLASAVALGGGYRLARRSR